MAGLRSQGTPPHCSDPSIPNRQRHPGPGFPGGLRDGADALVPPSHQSRPSTRSVRAWRSPAGGEAAPWAGDAARPAAGPGDGADGGLAAVMRGGEAQRPLCRGGRKLPLRVGGLRGKGKRRDGADSRREPVRPLGPSGRRAPAHTRPRGGGRPRPGSGAPGAPRAPPVPPPSAALPAAPGLDAAPPLLPLSKPSNPRSGALPTLRPPLPPTPRSCPVTPGLDNAKSVSARLIISKCLRRLAGTTRTPCCLLFCKYFPFFAPARFGILKSLKHLNISKRFLVAFLYHWAITKFFRASK